MRCNSSVQFGRSICALAVACIAIGFASSGRPAQAAPPAFGLGFTNSLNIPMAWIPPGTFSMGSPATEQHRVDNEGPLTEVTLSSGFWLGQFEITQGEWSELMTQNPSTSRGTPRLPVEAITWREALEFCQKLTSHERSAGLLPPGHEYRLPTAAQWEYACRAGTTTRFYYGDDPGYQQLGDFAWYLRNSTNTTHPVGLKKPNPWGLYDMHGNVWEWCLDEFDFQYPGGQVTDPEPRSSAGAPGFRGGGRASLDRMLRSAYRLGESPESGAMGVGFRVSLTSVVPEFSSEAEKVSYAVGTIFGLGLRGEALDLDTASIARGLTDTLIETNRTRLSGPQAHKILDAHRIKRRSEEESRKRQHADALALASDEFMAENLKREGVRILPSGVQYEIIRSGQGEAPGTNDALVVYLRGSSIGGHTFEDTYSSKTPARIIPGVHYLVPGLREALLSMPVGSAWKIYVPGRLGFPPSHPIPSVEPGSGLVFEIELLSKKPKDQVVAEVRQDQLVLNKKLGEEFLAKFAAEPGANALTNGIHYKQLKATSGPLPGTNDLVEVYWNLSLLDGTVLVSSANNASPTPLRMSQIAKSFRGIFEALSRMSVGSKWQLVIPFELAGGDDAHPPQIPPGSTLLCDLELVGVKRQASSNPGGTQQ